MAKYHGRTTRFYLNGYDISSLASLVRPTIETELAEYVVLDGSLGYHYLPGHGKDIMHVDGIFDDNYKSQLDALFEASTGYDLMVPFGIVLSSPVLASGEVLINNYHWAAVATDINKLDVDFVVQDARFDKCKLYFPKVQKTTDGNHTSVDDSADLVHKEKDTTNVVTSANASDQSTLEDLLNEIKADYNAHRISTTFHNAADTTNVVTSADATNLATALTLANEIKLDFNAHRVLAGVHTKNDPVNKIVSPDATTLATCITLANEIKTDYNTHLNVWYNGLIGYLQVFECGSDDALIVKVQESLDDGVGDAWADIITFATANGITTERKIATGEVERYLRVVWSGTPTYQATFAVALKRG